MKALTDLLALDGIAILPTFTGEFIRNGSQWFVGYTVGPVKWCAYGDFARDISKTWKTGPSLNAGDQQKLDAWIAAMHEKNREAREKQWGVTADEVEREWEGFSDRGESPYLSKKGVGPSLHGCRLEAHELGARTIVPARDVDGRLWGYQRIYSQKLDLGDKFFRKAAKKEGCFHILGSLDKEGAIYFCEGLATGASIAMALDFSATVVICFDAGNLLPVAASFRAKLPTTEFIFCADDDRWPGRDGKVHYTGQKKAEYAAKQVGNARVLLPVFTGLPPDVRPTDFNDLHALAGLKAVADQLRAKPSNVRKLPGVKVETLSPPKPKKVTEREAASRLLQSFGDDLLVQQRDVFVYRSGYWQHQGEDQVANLKIELGRHLGYGAGSRDIENAFRFFLIHAPRVPKGVNLFTPPYFMANFQNGTLHLTKDEHGKPGLAFRAHERKDYLTTQLPLDYPGAGRLEQVSPDFEAMLDRLFQGDPEAASKRRVLAQMFGAALMPCYPKIFFLVGKPGSGKSTVCKLLYHLVDPKNVCHVDPSEFSGFNMESMVGKQLNMDTDINLQRPIADSVIKKVTDRINFRIARKFQTDVIAPLAPVHVFGGNRLPKSMEGTTGAFARRIVIVRFTGFSAEAMGAGNYDLDFAERVWAQGKDGILAFALRGLMDLLESGGLVHSPDSSQEEVKEWDANSNPLTQFLDALEHKELDQGNQYIKHPEASITRKNLWEAFHAWQEMQGAGRRAWTNRDFNNAMREAGFGQKIIRGVRYWVGLGSTASPESVV